MDINEIRIIALQKAIDQHPVGVFARDRAATLADAQAYAGWILTGDLEKPQVENDR